MDWALLQRWNTFDGIHKSCLWRKDCEDTGTAAACKVHAWLLSSANDFILAKKIAVLIPLGGSPYLLILVTGILGGLAAGVAALFGNHLMAVLSPKDNE